MSEQPRTNPEYSPTSLDDESVIEFKKADPRLMSPEAARALLAARAAYELESKQTPDVNEQCRIYFLAVGEKLQTFREDKLKQSAA